MRLFKKGFAIMLAFAMLLAMVPYSAVANATTGQVEIPDSVFSDQWNTTYDTYYYEDGKTYAYQGKTVTFVNENTVQIEGESQTRKLKNAKASINVETTKTDGKSNVTITIGGIDYQIGTSAGKWNATYNGKLQVRYSDTGSLGDNGNIVSKISSSNKSATISFTELEDGTYSLKSGKIYEAANEWSPGIDFNDGKGIVQSRLFSSLPDITFTVGDTSGEDEPIVPVDGDENNDGNNEGNPAGYLGLKTETKVYDDFENDIWMQFQQKKIETGDTVRIYPWRVEQIVSDVISNDVQRPNFHFEIISGDSVTLSSESSKSSVNATATKPGTTIIKITYDEVNYKGNTWGAISDVNTGYVVLTVDENSNATISSSIDNWRHYDTIYYSQGETKPYDINVNTANAEQVKVTCNGIAVNPSGEGKYTLPLENRANIIGIEATDAEGKVATQYRILDARFIEIVVANKTNPNTAPAAGDTVNVSFKGITMPVYKLATIYNPQFNGGTSVLYSNESLGGFKGTCSQWDLADNNDFDVTFSQGGTYEFTSSGINCKWWGSVLGTDLTAGGPGEPNLNAPTLEGTFSSMPDFNIEVGGGIPVTDVSLNKSNVELNFGDAEVLEATVLPDNATLKTVTWSSSDDESVSVDNNGKIKALKAGKEVTIKAKSGNKEATCKVVVKAVTVDDAIDSINIIPEESEMDYSSVKVIEKANALYNQLSEEDKENILNYAKLEKALTKVNELKAMPPYAFYTEDGVKLMIEKTSETAVYGYPVYNVYVPSGDSKVVLTRYIDLSVYENVWNGSSLHEAGNTNLTLENIFDGIVIRNGNDKYSEENNYAINFVEEGLHLNKSSVVMNAGTVEILTARGTIQEGITWESSNKEVALVNPNGTIISLSPGTTVIKASAAGKETTVTVTVNAPDGDISGTANKTTVKQGEDITFTFEGVEIPSSVTDTIRDKFIKYNTTLDGVTNIKGSGTSGLNTVTMAVPEDAEPGTYYAYGGRLYVKHGGYLHPQFKVWLTNPTESYFYNGQMPVFAFEVEYSSVNAAASVDQMIESIGDVTVDSGNKISEAQSAYNNLSDEAKALVGKKANLNQAQNEYDAMKNAPSFNKVLPTEQNNKLNAKVSDNGDAVTITKSLSKGVMLSIPDMSADLLRGLSIDGNAISSENYIVSDENLIVTLKEDYINQLSLGTHMVRLETTKGYAEPKLVVTAAEKENFDQNTNSGEGNVINNETKQDKTADVVSVNEVSTVQTGDENPIGAAGLVLAISVAGLTVMLKRKKHNSN